MSVGRRRANMNRIADRPRIAGRRRAVAEKQAVAIADERIESEVEIEIGRRMNARSRTIVIAIAVVARIIVRSRDWHCHRRRRPLVPRSHPLRMRLALRRLIVTPRRPRSLRIMTASATASGNVILVVALVIAPLVLFPLPRLLLLIVMPNALAAASVAIETGATSAVDLGSVIAIASLRVLVRWIPIVLATVTAIRATLVIVIAHASRRIVVARSIRAIALCPRTTPVEIAPPSTTAAAYLSLRRLLRRRHTAALPLRPSLHTLNSTRILAPRTVAPSAAEATWRGTIRYRWTSETDTAAIRIAGTTNSETDEAEATAQDGGDVSARLSLSLAHVH